MYAGALTQARYPGRYMKKNIIITISLSAIAITACLSFGIYKKVQNETANMYAAMRVGLVIVDYLDTHNGKWPKSWNDLRPFFATRFGNNFDDLVDDIKDRVNVDWMPNLQHLQQRTPENPLVIVRCYSGNQSGPTKATNANRIIAEYYQRKKKESYNQTAAPDAHTAARP